MTNTFSLEDWEKAAIEPFNLEDAYKADVEPLMHQLHGACRKLGIPFFARAFYEQSATGVQCHTVAALPSSIGMIPPQAIMAVLVEHPNQAGVECMLAVVESTTNKIRAHFGSDEAKH